MNHENKNLEMGRDEMNLVEFPITLLAKRQEPGTRTIKFADTIAGEKDKPIKREWTVTGSDEFGLPLAIDNDVLLAIMLMGKNNNFENRTIHFSRYKLCKIMGWDIDGRAYRRIEDALDRLKGVSVKAKNAFWDNERKAYVTTNFGIIDNYELLDSSKAGPAGQESFPFSYVNLNEVIFKSIKAGYIKSLDAKVYFGFESAITKKLFRYLDKKRYDGKKKFEINIYALAYHHIGFDSDTYKYASKIKEKLNTAHRELIEIGFIKSAEYQKTSDGSTEKVVYVFGKKGELLEPVREQEREEGPPEEELLRRLQETGISGKVAEQLLREYPQDLIEKQLEALPYRKAADAPAVLIASIQGEWALPPKYLEKVKEEDVREREREERGEEERVKAERRRRIERYISSLSKDELVELTKEARGLLMDEGGALFREREVPDHMLKAYIHMAVESRLGVER
ncbi:MAG: plasmid replication initiator TrfA [Candidatus Eremiobacteraeota bacterium]|nr:plasmid replication initiator TrfA [Candidatus Eremiobacteraeota bacterium]